MGKIIITFLNGIKAEMPDGYTIIDANNEKNVRKLISYNKVQELNDNGGAKYGTLNNLVLERKTGFSRLKRGDTFITEPLDGIVPITRISPLNLKKKPKNHYGIIFCEDLENGNYFLVYEIDFASSDLLSTKTQYCILDSITGSIIAIKDYHYTNNNDIKYNTTKKEEIIEFIKNYPQDFSINQIKEELFNAKILESKDIVLLQKVIDYMVKSSMLESHTTSTPEHNIYYSNVKKHTKVLAPTK